MKNQSKRKIRVNLTQVDEDLAQALGRELEGGQTEDARSATGWNDPYRASGTKHSAVNLRETIGD